VSDLNARFCASLAEDSSNIQGFCLSPGFLEEDSALLANVNPFMIPQEAMCSHDFYTFHPNFKTELNSVR
jgi:hypothetical protein